MPKLKAGTIAPKLEEDTVITAANEDLDARPFTDAERQKVRPLARRGRPLGSGSKTQVTLRIDTEVLDRLKATGAGWQTRANDALRRWVKRHA